MDLSNIIDTENVANFNSEFETMVQGKVAEILPTLEKETVQDIFAEKE